VSGISIDRLALEIPGISEKEARELAAAIGQNLAKADYPPGVRDLPTLRIDLSPQGAGFDRALMAEQIASEILMQIKQLP
jgi:hypothetical protein